MRDEAVWCAKEVVEVFRPVPVEKGNRLGGGERPEGLAYEYLQRLLHTILFAQPLEKWERRPPSGGRLPVG